MTDHPTPDVPSSGAAAVRRGRLQFAALRGLMRTEMGGRTDLAAAFPAARTAARFAAAEGWADGPLWHSQGPELLLARWALDHGVSAEQIRDHVRDVARSGSGAAPGSGAGSAPSTTAAPAPQARPVPPRSATPADTARPVTGRERPFR